MTDIQAILRKVVDEIWVKFDEDKSGKLDIEEAKEFVKSTLAESGEASCFNEGEFNKLFKEKFDIDGDGTVDKEEMLKFIMEISGLDTA